MKVGSLFSGIGGFDLGLEQAGFTVEWQSEIEPYCCKVLKKHWPGVPNLGDIYTIKDPPPVDLICGGFPCQPFSVAGKRQGKADDRYIWPQMLRVITEVKPRWVFAENVPGILHMELDQVLSDLEGQGYETGTLIIPACALNAPHRRSRVWIISYNTELPRYGRYGTSQTQPDSDWTQNRLSQPTDRHAPDTESRPFTSTEQASTIGRKDARQDIGRGVVNAPDTEGQGLEGREPEGARCPGGCTPEYPVGYDWQNQAESWQVPWPEVATRLCRVDDGLPEEMDTADRKLVYNAVGYYGAEEVGRRLGIDCSEVENRLHRVARLKALGNAIVPQIAEEIGRMILKLEAR